MLKGGWEVFEEIGVLRNVSWGDWEVLKEIGEG